MNKETFVIKNYVLSVDVLYLDYAREEEICYRNVNKKTRIDITKNKVANSFKENGASLRF